MKRYWAVVILIFLLFLVFFLLAEYLYPTLFIGIDSLMVGRNTYIAVIGIGLLTVDVILPIPSSLIMISNGVIFGVTLGTTLSLIGSLLATATGFLIGRWGGGVLGRFVSPEERQRADELLIKWGSLAIIVTRPIPLLAETTAIIAGTSSMSWMTMIVASLAGTFPVALLFALTGATAMRFDNALLAFGLVLLVAGMSWYVGQRNHTRLHQQ